MLKHIRGLQNIQGKRNQFHLWWDHHLIQLIGILNMLDLSDSRPVTLNNLKNLDKKLFSCKRLT